jgi:hypothetical protein
MKINFSAFFLHFWIENARTLLAFQIAVVGAFRGF